MYLFCSIRSSNLKVGDTYLDQKVSPHINPISGFSTGGICYVLTTPAFLHWHMSTLLPYYTVHNFTFVSILFYLSLLFINMSFWLPILLTENFKDRTVMVHGNGFNSLSVRAATKIINTCKSFLVPGKKDIIEHYVDSDPSVVFVNATIFLHDRITAKVMVSGDELENGTWHDW